MLRQSPSPSVFLIKLYWRWYVFHGNNLCNVKNIKVNKQYKVKRLQCCQMVIIFAKVYDI